MNETLKVESAYFKALGIDTEYVEGGEYEYLVSLKTGNEMFSLVHDDQQTIALMLTHEINVEFREQMILATPREGLRTWQPYGDAQWQTKAWALGMAVVRASTEKILRSSNDKT